MRRWGLAAVAGCLLLAAAPAQAACNLGKLLELPVTMSGLRPMVNAKINGRDAQFVVDSGAFYSLMWPGTAAEYKLDKEPAPFDLTVSGAGGSIVPSVTKVRKFGLGGAEFKDVLFIVGGNELVGAGVIGQNVLGLADVEYDLGGGSLRLMRPSGCPTNRNYAYWAAAVGKPVSHIDLEATQGLETHIRATVIVNGVKLRAIFDTAASGTVLSTAAAARAGITPDSPGVTAAGTAGGIGRRMLDRWGGKFDSIQIGDEQIRNVKLRFGELSDNSYDILIGVDFFLSHRIYVSKANQRMYFTYNGGPVFSLVNGGGAAETNDAALAGLPEPTNADDFARRGAILETRGDLPRALADFSKAIELAPGEGRYFVCRAGIYWQQGDRPKALADFDQAVKLKPNDADIRIARATALMRMDKLAEATADIDVAARLTVPGSDDQKMIGMLYTAVDQPAKAIPHLDLWLDRHKNDRLFPTVLNSRCWARALANVEPAKGLDDCNRAYKMQPDPAILDSRGLIYLRLGELDKALADFNAALSSDPKLPWSLYGRGIIELRRGKKAEGEADIAKAVKLRPELARQAELYGIKP